MSVKLETIRYIHKCSDFLVALISVGLAQARPNYQGLIGGPLYIAGAQDAACHVIVMTTHQHTPLTCSNT